MTDPGREADLWSAALRYDDRAFAALFDLHRDRVFRHALRLVSARSEAEDIVAMTFAALWRRREAVRVVEGSVLPWLLVTATNHARNHSRGARRYQSLLHRLPHSVEEDPAGIVAERLDRQQVAGKLGAALRRLSETDAVLLTLTVLEGGRPPKPPLPSA